MKKHIIIAGVPRSGKSTVSQMIARKLGYQHISMDSVIAGIETVFPETGVNSDADIDPKANIEYISSKMAPFIRAMTDSGEYNECDYGMVIDIYQLLPKDFVRYIDTSVCDIFYFVTAAVTADERYELLKKYDTPRDYTYYKSEEENRKSCAEIVEISRLLKAQCGEYGLTCIETSHDRERILKDFIDSHE